MAAAPASAAICDNYFHADFLQRELVVDRVEQIERAAFRHFRAAKFDPRIFAGELRMHLSQLAIEEERDVGVELFLELEELQIGIIPRARLEHH